MNIQIRAVVITVSDACASGHRADTSGGALVELLSDLGAEIVEKKILADDLDPLTDTLRALCDRGDINLIVTTGGTGLGPRDNTPEATLKVIEREAPGVAGPALPAKRVSRSGVRGSSRFHSQRLFQGLIRAVRRDLDGGLGHPEPGGQVAN